MCKQVYSLKASSCTTCMSACLLYCTCSYYNTGWCTGLFHFWRVNCLNTQWVVHERTIRRLLLTWRRRGTQNKRWLAFSDWVSARDCSFLAGSLRAQNLSSSHNKPLTHFVITAKLSVSLWVDSKHLSRKVLGYPIDLHHALKPKYNSRCSVAWSEETRCNVVRHLFKQDIIKCVYILVSNRMRW